jgi:RNA polymerase sigma-70 factor (ECF subfamily)
VNARSSQDRPASATPSDAELLAEIARDDLSALGTLFDRHHRRVERVLVRSGVSGSDADDIVQSTFLEVTRVAHAFDGRASCAAWLCGIALRLAARRRRSLGRLLKNVMSFGRHVPSDDPVHPECVVSSREELELFARALGKLGRKKREAFILVEIEGFSSEEAGRAMGSNPATMRTRLFHARSELRAAMRRGGR